jgi:hypothetical protein
MAETTTTFSTEDRLQNNLYVLEMCCNQGIFGDYRKKVFVKYYFKKTVPEESDLLPGTRY